MATLIEVFAEFFRGFGYAPTLGVELEGTTGRRHAVPLLLEKDTRRLAATTWAHRQELGPHFVDEFIDAVKDAGCDGGLIVSLGAVPETLAVRAATARVQVWDSRRAAQELGNAVLRETSPDAWQQTDPWTAPRPSRVLDQVRQAVLAAETPAPPAAPAPPQVEGLPPTLATPEQAPPGQLELPLAFGVLDQAQAAAPATEAPVPAAPAPTVPEDPPPRAGPRVLRLQVNRALAVSLGKARTRSADRLFLRLHPHYVFAYEANLLVDGSLETQKQTGRIAVDASTKRVRPWTHALDVADLPADGTDVDEKPVRVAESDARRLATAELQTLVTRDVVMEEDDSEWSVVVKKKVELAENELKLDLLGVFWLPLWRVTGKDGSVEIDGTSGQVVFEEIATARSDAVLI